MALGAIFEDGTSWSARPCKEDPDMRIELRINQLIQYVKVHESSDGYLTCLSFYSGDQSAHDDWTLLPAPTDKMHKSRVLNAKLEAVRCGMNECGHIESLTFLFTAEFQRNTIGTLPTLDMPAETETAFEYVDISRSLSTLSLHSDGDVVRGACFVHPGGQVTSYGDTNQLRFMRLSCQMFAEQ